MAYDEWSGTEQPSKRIVQQSNKNEGAILRVKVPTKEVQEKEEYVDEHGNTQVKKFNKIVEIE